MTLLDVARSPAAGVVVVLVLLALYAAACALWPWARCLRCVRSPGKRRAWVGSSWGACRWCGGSGKRVRVGRRILDAWRARDDS